MTCEWPETGDCSRVLFAIILEEEETQVQVLNWMPQPRALMGEVCCC